jgi:hypothetical protein
MLKNLLIGSEKVETRELTCRTCLSKYKQNADMVSVFSQAMADVDYLRISDMLESFTFIEVCLEKSSIFLRFFP